MKNSLHVLIIGYVWPEPNSSAAGYRMLQLIQCFLKNEWQVSFATPAQPTDHMTNLKSLKVSCHNIQVNDDTFDAFIKEKSADIVVFDRFMMEEQFGWRVEKHSPDSLRVLNTEDLHSLREARHKAVKHNTDFQITDMYSDSGVREIASIHRSDLTLMVSEHETELLQQHFQVPQTHLMHLPFMTSPLSTMQKSTRKQFEDRQHLVWIGNFRHAPNWDAVLQLKQTYWPIIRKKLKENNLNNVELHIYGAYPPPKATQLNNEKEKFLVKGWAEDASEVMQNTRLCVAPIRFGAGIKGKLYDAMLAGTPSITTSIGAEAMNGPFPWNGVITDDAEEFASATVSLYKDKTSWTLMQENGDRIIEERYDINTWEVAFINRLKRQLNLKEALRHSHFTGKMLRHHSMKSTQYMSQWITLKNGLTNKV
ncbi:glycosyltransferase [Marinomonas balearica]|uniref:Glycosyltransferase involved in cell wall biosynthesis n=1 Tax=Marinomonas balearica TaxID=491947 RepID=A0A4R6MHK6_9GAMM|nr:glycosyltransferase family 4 protein [Marinomonas balearica]TDO99649.1 glycosyltransferase involved in cell wall biosynthesis [Marinomonas balearica]